MKGSAITGPVAKECVRFSLLSRFISRSDFFFFGVIYRQICGPVLRRMRELSYDCGLFLSFLVFDYHGINKNTPMHINLSKNANECDASSCRLWF
jgi:hypothetical protein